MRILVIGGAGFIGSAVCRHIVGDLGHMVVNVDALTYAANLASLDSIAALPNYRFEQADIRDHKAMDAVLGRHQPDAIMHLAAESHVDRSISGSAIFLETNIVGTATLLEAVRAYRDTLPAERADALRMLYISTDEVYVSFGYTELFTEETPYDPSSSYCWRAQESLETSIAKTVRWYLDNEAWWRPLRGTVYSGQPLGLLKAVG